MATKKKVKKSTTERAPVVGFSAEQELVNRIDKAAKKKNLSRAKFVREAVSKALVSMQA